jgi:uridine phosphorylase
VVTVTDEDAIINPGVGKRSPQLGPVAVMVATEPDLAKLCCLLNLNPNTFQKLFISRLYVDKEANPGISLTGPIIGAPYATMLLETLIAWGACKILFLGWCGAISENVKIGDIILPTSAIIDEGTSGHYISDKSESVPSEGIVAQSRQVLRNAGLKFHQGIIWSTDAVYRETRDRVAYFQKKDVLSVEMETSSIFTVGRFRDVQVGGILVVSDELSDFQWRPGFKTKKFEQARSTACRVVMKICQMLLIQT